MKTASFLGVILPQTPVHLVQILNSIFQLPRHTYIQPKFYEDIQLDDERSKPNDNDLDWPGFTGFVAKIYQSQITRFWGQILNSICCLCKKFDISQLWSLSLFLTVSLCFLLFQITIILRQDGGEILNGCDPNTAIGGFLLFPLFRAICAERGFEDAGAYGK